MKIALIGSIWITIPPKDFGFGSQEYLQYELIEGLIKKGHDVTLFAAAGAKTKAKLVPAAPQQVIDLQPADNRTKETFELMNLSEAFKRAGDFDIIHNHLLPHGLLFPDLVKTPVVHTLHHQIYKTSEIYLYRRFKSQNFVSISNAQRNIMPELSYVDTVYNSIDTNAYKYQEIPGGNYLLYLGRLKRYKGVHTAIKLAQKLGLNLKIAFPDPNPSQPDYEEVNEYWQKDIKPEIGKHIEHIGQVSGQEKIKILQNAKALIFPVEREEPFGMSVIEAMSCGTPVIVYGKGALPELVADTKTGYIVKQNSDDPATTSIKETGLPGLEKAVNKIFNMTSSEYTAIRQNSRLAVEQNFSISKMVEGYEAVYKKILG